MGGINFHHGGNHIISKINGLAGSAHLRFRRSVTGPETVSKAELDVGI
jgi:hypothetical protein